jgi:hypothetical protein
MSSRELQQWEQELLAATRIYVRKQCPQLPPDKREEVVARIYADMRRTLKLFH